MAAAVTSEVLVAAKSLLPRIESLVPALTGASYKGQHGRIAVLGGSLEYCGAPFYAAAAALKCGADIAHILCAEEAAIPIKSYSPEVIVHPVLKSGEEGAPIDDKTVQGVVSAVADVMQRVHVLVVGPGLGRNPLVMACTKHILQRARDTSLPVVVDADGLWMLSQAPEVLQGHPWAVVTPNIVEFWRLCEATGVAKPDGNAWPTPALVATLAQRLGNATVLLKGPQDTITNGDGRVVLSPDDAVCLRRCGGQGDIVAGTTGVFLAWAHQAARKEARSGAAAGAASSSSRSGAAGAGAGAGAATGGSAATPGADTGGVGASDACADTTGGTASAVPWQVAGVAAASMLTRASAGLAFARLRRGMTTPDILHDVPTAFEHVFPACTPVVNAHSESASAASHL